jgi:hypothetical protein
MAIIEVQVNDQLNEIGGLRSGNAALKRKIANMQVKDQGQSKYVQQRLSRKPKWRKSMRMQRLWLQGYKRQPLIL